MSGPSEVERIERLAAIDGPSLTVELTNTYGDEVNAGARTISHEAFMFLRDEMATWVGTRLQRRMDAGGRAVNVNVTVTVEFPE